MCINHAIFGGLIAIGGSELLTSLDYIFEVGLTKDVSETGKMVVNLGMGSFGAVVGLLVGVEKATKESPQKGQGI